MTGGIAEPDPCPGCRGSGRNTNYYYSKRHSKAVYVTCDMCEGTGSMGTVGPRSGRNNRLKGRDKDDGTTRR